MRVFSLVKGLKEHFGKSIDILVLQSGKKQGILPFHKYAVMKIIPYSVDKKGLFIEEGTKIYKKIISEGKLEPMLKERLSFVKKNLSGFKPTVFITEYFPFGQEFWTFELPYILQYLKEDFNCKIVGSSGYVNCSDNIHENIKTYYDYLFIHSPEEFSQDYHKYLHRGGAQVLDNVFRDFSSKIYFTGFVFEDSVKVSAAVIRKRYLDKDSRKLILVSRGGGIVNKKIIIAAILAARQNKDLFFIVSCGPATSEKEFSEYKKLSGDMRNLKLLKVIEPSEFDAHIKAVDLSVNMSGYNTTARLLYYGTKTVLIPYYTSEQRWRADLVTKYLPSRIIPEKELKVNLLEKNIRELLEDTAVPVELNKAWFCGVSNTAEKLKCLI